MKYAHEKQALEKTLEQTKEVGSEQHHPTKSCGCVCNDLFEC